MQANLVEVIFGEISQNPSGLTPDLIKRNIEAKNLSASSENERISVSTNDLIQCVNVLLTTSRISAFKRPDGTRIRCYTKYCEALGLARFGKWRYRDFEY